LCNSAPACLDSGRKGGPCYLGIAKFALCSLAFTWNSILIPPCLLWWFTDAALIIDNGLRNEESINSLGIIASFEHSTLEGTKNLSFTAAAQFGLELALFLPAVVAFTLGSNQHSLRSLRERLRPLQPRGASAHTIDSATSTLLYQAGQSGSKDEVCSICCDVFQDRDCVRQLPCKHQYHKACVDRWLSLNPTCPLCKDDITNQGHEEVMETYDLSWQQAVLVSMNARL